MKLSDLMSAEQALKILEYCESLEKRIENLENENKAMRYELTWGSINRDVEIYKTYNEKEF